GGGRSSYRSTISDVVGGSVARIFLRQRFGTAILASISQVGPLRSQRTLADHFERWIHDHPGAPIPQEELDRVEAQMAQAEIRSLDAEFAQAAGQLIKETRIAGDSLGAAVEVVAVNVPA